MGATASSAACAKRLRSPAKTKEEPSCKGHQAEVAVKVYLVSGQQVADVTLSSACTVAELKAMVKQYILQGARPLLVHGSRVLRRGNQTLAEAEVPSCSILTLLAQREHLWAKACPNAGSLVIDENDTCIFARRSGERYQDHNVVISQNPSKHYRVRVITDDEYSRDAMQAGFVSAAPADRPDMQHVSSLSASWPHLGQRWLAGYQGSEIFAGKTIAKQDHVKVRPQFGWARCLWSGCIVDLKLYSHEGSHYFQVSVDEFLVHLVEIEQPPSGEVYPAVALHGNTCEVELIDRISEA